MLLLNKTDFLDYAYKLIESEATTSCRARTSLEKGGSPTLVVGAVKGRTRFGFVPPILKLFRLRPIRHSFSNIFLLYALMALKVCYGTGNLKNAVQASAGKIIPFHGKSY
jgi:hypothetical protein